MKKIILTVAMLLNMATIAYAIPSLQLDIANGWYNEEGGTTYDPGTITSAGDIFDLYALAKTYHFSSESYYLSAALTPKTSAGVSAGSFDITYGGTTTTVNVSSGMTFGTPPIETNNTAATDSGDLARHGIFETYFREFKFDFDTSERISSYNTQDRAINGGLIDLNTISNQTAGLYFQKFAVDTTNLASGYEIHFDLYSESYARLRCTTTTDLDIDKFAPFSHDAASGGTTPVPEPGTMVLFGLGMLGLAVYGKRRMNKDT